MTPQRDPTSLVWPMIRRRCVTLLVAMAFGVIGGNVGRAQQQSPPAQAPMPAPAPTPQQQFLPSSEWQKLPKMQLERQFAGPLQDTVVQRWRDPVDGTVCYIYLPISAPHSPPTSSGFVQYGSTATGSISCNPSPPAQAPKRR